MKIAYLNYTCKAGESKADYSDAFFPDCRSLTGKSNVFALSDGTTQGMLNREWANILVKSFAGLAESRLDIKEVLLKAIDRSVEQWESIRQQYVASKNSVLDENEYKWLFEYGSHATFLGLRFGSDHWEAVAVGDTCLFVLGGRESAFPFPIERASSFTDSPRLISSSRAKNTSVGQYAKHVKKKLARGDTFYLMTDALAHWFLSEWEVGAKPWNLMRDSLSETDNLALVRKQTKGRMPQFSLRRWPWRPGRRATLVGVGIPSSKTSFQDWVDKLRESGAVANDDTTLMILRP